MTAAKPRYQSLPVDRPVGAAALNAGVGARGAFIEQDLGTVLRIVDLNRSTVHLAKRLLDDMARRPVKDDPARVAAQGFAAMMEGRPRVVGSLRTKAQAQLNKVLPDGAKATAHRRMAQPQDD